MGKEHSGLWLFIAGLFRICGRVLANDKGPGKVLQPRLSRRVLCYRELSAEVRLSGWTRPHWPDAGRQGEVVTSGRKNSTGQVARRTLELGTGTRHTGCQNLMPLRF